MYSNYSDTLVHYNFYSICFLVFVLNFSSGNELDELTFNKLAEETLESLCDLFEDLGDSDDCPSDYDVTYGVC